VHSILHIMVDLGAVGPQIELLESRALHLREVNYETVDHEVLRLAVDHHDKHCELQIDREGVQ
jgi:hypothetical protein